MRVVEKTRSGGGLLRSVLRPWSRGRLAAILVCGLSIVLSASTVSASEFDLGFEKTHREDLEAMIENYVAGYNGMDGPLPAIDITFTHLSGEGNRLALEVTVMPFFRERMSTIRTWLKLAPELKLVKGKIEWEGSVSAFGHQSFESVIVPDSAEARSVKAYAVAVEAGGRIMSCFCDYWVKPEDDRIVAAYDPEMKERVLVCRDASPDDLPAVTGVKTDGAVSDSAEGMIFAFDAYPSVVYSESAVYPEEARKARAQGTVMIMVTIDEFGDVINAWVATSDHELLDAPALEAAQKFKFVPASQRGHRVKATICIPFRFSLTR